MTDEIASNEVAKINTGTQVAVSTQSQMIQIISDLAKDPNTDVEKMDKILDIQIKMMDRQAQMDFNAAFMRVQQNIPYIPENGTIKTKDGKVTSRYMEYKDIDAAMKPLLKANGFAIMHSAVDNGNGKMTVTTTLLHEGGHEKSVSCALMYDKPNALKNECQASISTQSYGMRKNYQAMFNIVSEQDDKSAVNSEAHKITDEQAKEIKDWMAKLFNEGKDIDTLRYLKFFGVPTIEDIPSNRYQDAIDLLRRKENS